ncbi:MAG: DUF1788 domain-containing protein [Scytonematopsis contorta HA4267-MV1]|jgi:hypothetical protein|nr:DUF1788 domain-containing protein [Scytonematopsis contorta HA4267-MV1]
MLSLLDRISLLEHDLKAVPPRISVHNDLPFAILRYDPREEWQVRKEAKLLATRLGDCGKDVLTISLAELLWQAIKESEGLEVVLELERERGFNAAQEQVNVYLSDRDWRPLTDLLIERLKALNPQKYVVFLTRAAAMAPAIYQMSKLLDEMQGKTRIVTIANEGIGVWVSGFFGSGKSSFAKNLGYILANRSVKGANASKLFKNQINDQIVGQFLDLINARIPTEVIMFDVSVDRAVKKGTERIAEVMYTVLLRELDYAEDYDIAELEIELEREDKLDEFIAHCQEIYKIQW